jgi:hypothetical protein
MTLSNRQLRLVGAFAALNILLVVVGWVALVSPQRSDAATAAAQAQAVQTELASLAVSSPGSNKNPPIHTSDIYKLDTALPAQVDQPDLVFELDRLATASGVHLLNVAPQAASAATGTYTVQPINLSVNGTYFNITGFVRSLRMLVAERRGRLIANGPLFSVTSLSLAQGAAADQTGQGEVATIGMAAFYYGVTGGASPPASTTDTSTTTTTGG